MKAKILFLIFLGVLVTMARAAENVSRTIETYGSLPLSFEPNQGQTDPQVKFLAREHGYTLFLTPTDAVLRFVQSGEPQTPSALKRALPTHNEEPSILSMELVGANAASRISGVDELPGKSNYFMGNDPKRWHTNVPSYSKVRYENVYPGIDLVYYGNQRRLEYDFLVAPGIDPRLIRLRFQGQEEKGIRVDRKTGDLVLASANGEVRFHKPIAYQLTMANRQPTTDAVTRNFIEASYLLKSNGHVGIQLAAYDESKPLVIDPVLTHSSYLGGSSEDVGESIAVDSSGNVYVTGYTVSVDFPRVNQITGACPGACGSDAHHHAFVTKVNTTGDALVYSSYLGGSGFEVGGAIAVDGSGNAYVAGTTQQSPDFPRVNQITGACKGTCGTALTDDLFLTKINSTGDALLYSSLLGGSNAEEGGHIAIDVSNNVYLTGLTESTDFPQVNQISGACQGTCGTGGNDAFVTKVNAAGDTLVYSSYLGGSGPDATTGISADASGNAYVVGFTGSTDFPRVNQIPSACQGTCGGPTGGDAFVTKIDAAGDALVYSSVLGGSGNDAGEAIGLDGLGNVYITGLTISTDFPQVSQILGACVGTCGTGAQANAFMTKINAAGDTLLYSSYLGGSGTDNGQAMAVDSSGNAFITGRTNSPDFPQVFPIPGGCKGTCGTSGAAGDAFVAKINAAGNLLVYSSYIGGSSFEQGDGIAVGSSGAAYVVGDTFSTDFPRMNQIPGACVGKCGTGDRNAFLIKILPGPVVALNPASLKFAPQKVGTTSSAQLVTLTNTGDRRLMISSIVTSGDFAQTNTCSSALASNAHCTIQVTFKPTAPRIRQGSLSVTDNAQRSPQTVSLSGLGVGPVVQLSPTAVTFATRLVGTASAAQTVTLTNTGNGMLTISGITTTGDFTRTHNCGTTVAAGASCIISVTFKPTAKGVRSGLLTVTDNAAGGQQTVTLKGTGTVVQLSTTRLTFGTQTVGTTTAAKTVRLTNIGTTVLSITSITITGTNAGDFTQTNTCGVGVAAGGSCVITAKFKPTLKGTRIATVSVSDNGGGSPQSVSLLGTGTVVSLSPTTLNFGSQKVGTISAAKIVTLTNVGTTTLNITSITKSGSDPGDFSLNNTCGKSVASGGKCSIIVRFIPTTAGLRTAMVNINDDGGGSPQNVPLSGNGT